MSTFDPPKAWYEYRCYECGKIVEGHAEDICSEVPEVHGELTGDGEDVLTSEEIKEAYLKGRINKEQMESELDKLYGLK